MICVYCLIFEVSPIVWDTRQVKGMGFWVFLALVPSLRRYYFEKFKVKQDCTGWILGETRWFCARKVGLWKQGRLGGFLAAYPKGLCGRFVLGLGLLLPGQAFLHYMSERISIIKPGFQGCPSWTWFYPYHYAPATQFTTRCEPSLCATWHPWVYRHWTEAFCLGLDWLRQFEVWWDQLFPASWLDWTCILPYMGFFHMFCHPVFCFLLPSFNHCLTLWDSRSGQPFQPFQQLMSVLPPVSAEEVSCLHFLLLLLL